jgi:hypothetical protein
MGFGRAQTISQERRQAERSELACPARLKTAYSSWQGQLTDISVSGARFRTEQPPRQGVPALLQWDSHETMCEIIWTGTGECGVRFERHIPDLAVHEVTHRHIRQEGQAALGNIPLGRRRNEQRP